MSYYPAITQVDYIENDTLHSVVIQAETADVFARALQMEATRGKEGEALVAALVDVTKGQGLISVQRLVDEELSDGPNGEPAIQNWSRTGTLVAENHYHAGVLNDGAQGEPALRKWTEWGAPVHEIFMTEGKTSDSTFGQPALKIWDPSGALVQVTHFKNGEAVRALRGESLQAFADAAADQKRAEEEAVAKALDNSKLHRPKGRFSL